MAMIELKSLLENAPSEAKLVLAGMLILGLIVWVWGRKLAKPICTVTGPFIGGVVGLVVAHSIGWRGGSLTASLIGAITGFGAAWLLFRVWMAISLAIVLCVALPAAAVGWTLSSQPAATQPATQDSTQIAMPLRLIDAPAEVTSNLMPKPTNRRERLIASIHEQLDEVKIWWQDLPDGAKIAALVPAAIGAAVGMFLGLWKPLLAASVESSLLGGLLWFLAARELLRLYWPWAGEHLPKQSHMVLLLLSLITLLGVLIQWTIYQRQADK